MNIKSQEDYIKEIAQKINNAICHEIKNPTKEDILALKEFDYIVTPGKHFPVMIRRRYTIDNILGIPTVMWYDGYEMGDTVMGMIPETCSVEEILEGLKGFKDIE